MVLEKAKRLVEHKKDVVILLDSITRLGGPTTPSSPPRGRSSPAASSQRPPEAEAVLRGGPEHRGRGSLTIIATASSRPAAGWTR